MERINDVRTKVTLFNLRYATAAVIGFAGMLTKDIPGTRNRLPEPFDLMDHVGNVNISWQTGAIAGLAIGAYAASTADMENRPLDVPKSRLLMGVAGFAVGLVLNSFSETKFGLQVLDIWNEITPDVVDLAYGTAATTASAAAIPTFKSE